MKKTKNIYLYLNILLLILSMSCLIYYDIQRGIILKGITSGWFVLIGIINIVFAYQMKRRKTTFMWLILFSLICSMAADVMLGIHFLIGIILFASGHIFYVAAYCTLERFHRKDILPCVLISLAALLCVFATPFITIEDSVLKYMLGGYSIVISFMLGKSIANLKATPTKTRYLVFAGSLLFWFSDLMLALNMFGTGGSLAGTLCMYTYWPGQYLQAHMLYHYVIDRKESLL